MLLKFINGDDFGMLKMLLGENTAELHRMGKVSDFYYLQNIFYMQKNTIKFVHTKSLKGKVFEFENTTRE